jgi:hypothetical protein
MNQLAGTETADPRWSWLYRIGGAAALIVLVLFLIGALAGPVAPFQDNWLSVLLKLNAGLGDVQEDSLSVLSFVDVAIMALTGTVYLALCAALWRTNKLWPAIAASMAFLGIALLIITHTAGRSGLLLGGLIVSAVMLRSRIFSRACAYAGMVAGALLLFVGDIGTALFAPSNIIAVSIGVGYLLWMGWFFVVGRKLLQLGGSRPLEYPSQASGS